MKAYLKQDQIIRRERRRRLMLAGCLGGGLLAVSAAALFRGPATAVADNVVTKNTPLAIAIAEPARDLAKEVIAASPGDERFRKQLEPNSNPDLMSTVKGWFTMPATPTYIPESAYVKTTAVKPQAAVTPVSADAFAPDHYAGAVAANSLQPQSGEEKLPVSAVVEEDNTPTQTVIADSAVNDDGKLELGAGRSSVINTKGPYKRVSVGQPEIADVNTIGPTSILVTARKAGATQVIIWDENDKSQTVDVIVGFDLDALREQIKKSFPNAKVEVDAVNGAIALRGKAPSVDVAEQIVAMAAPFSEKVLNFLEISGGQQVMLQVKFVEMSRRASEELGINLLANYNDGNTNISFAGPNTGSKGSNGLLSTVVGAFVCNSFSFDYALSALKQNNLARILAEPNVTVISGQEATLLAGGEFPVPVPQSGSGGGSTITIEYREFGVRLNVTPVVLGSGKIRLKVAPEVSDLDFSSPIVIENNNIPIILKRRVESTVEMLDGQTFAIGGLMRNTVTASRAITPLLGDLPIIGTLFRSVRYQREETELVVLVTPSLVEAMNPGEVPDAPGEFWRHPNPVEFYLNGNIGQAERAPRNPVDALPARFRGEYGFAPSTQTASVEQ